MAYATQVSGRKLQNQLISTLNESVATGPSSFARRQLELMGWTEGQGLGKNKQGISTHIKVTKRKDEEGLGHEKKIVQEAGDQWWYHSVGETLAKLQKDKKKKKKKEKEEESSSTMRQYTDEELFVATGGARFGMRAQRRAEGKWARTEKDEELKVLEVKAKESMEWNGLGNAKVLLTSSVVVKNTRKVTRVAMSLLGKEDKWKSVSSELSSIVMEEQSSGSNPLHTDMTADSAAESTPEASADEQEVKKDEKKTDKKKDKDKKLNKKRKHEHQEVAEDKEKSTIKKRKSSTTKKE